jgi:ribosomal protein L22
MKYSMQVTKSDAYGKTTLSVSRKHAVKVCRAINRKKLNAAKDLLSNLIAMKRDLRGKYYTKTAKEILKTVKDVEHNAKQKNLDLESLLVYASANKGFTQYRLRRKSKHGKKLKITNVQIVLRGKDGRGKEVRKGSDKK